MGIDLAPFERSSLRPTATYAAAKAVELVTSGLGRKH